MNLPYLFPLVSTSVAVSLLSLSGCQTQQLEEAAAWTVDSDADWAQSAQDTASLKIEDGLAKSIAATSEFSSVVKSYPTKRSAKSITFKQTTAWDNWKEIPKVGLPEMDDAPVFIPVQEGEYWLLARYIPADLLAQPKKERKDKRPASEKGYHAYFSTDMVNWVHKGPVSGERERWVTTAEYVDGQFYIYYDHPNDQDPHLIIDEDLGDGKMGQDMGMVFADPSHGSDCAIFRDDADGHFHLIYENWDPINARTHAWDSPLAGHAVSPDGISDFKILDPAVDHRTTPTGTYGEYTHSSSQEPLKYEIHEPEQNAYGDWTAIKIGGQYYLFCDFDPVGRKIRAGRFTSGSLNEEFTFVGELGEGHPDPTVGFAEGQFYLIRQRAKTDFVSSGPWVGGVEARVGVDTDGDRKVDEWTAWQVVQERYSQKPGFLRVVDTAPASIDLTSLPAGFGFAFEYRTSPIDDQQVSVQMDQVKIEYR